MAGRVFVVATPIGNLEDITHRALRVLEEVSLIACEDTRVTRKLLSRYEIETPTASLHAHSDASAVDRLLDRVEAGEDIAYVSDAGTPLISDPGASLVDRAVARGLRVEPIPGPSAVLTALSAAAVVSSRFVFLGFLPRGEHEQRELLASLRGLPGAIVLFEAPSRLASLLELSERVFGDRQACVARELTKRFETFERGRLSELRGRFETPPKGEIVVVIGPPEGEAAADDEPRSAKDEVRRQIESGAHPSEIAKLVAGAYGLSRKEAYRMVLDVQAEREEV